MLKSCVFILNLLNYSQQMIAQQDNAQPQFVVIITVFGSTYNDKYFCFVWASLLFIVFKSKNITLLCHFIDFWMWLLHLSLLSFFSNFYGPFCQAQSQSSAPGWGELVSFTAYQATDPPTPTTKFNLAPLEQYPQCKIHLSFSIGPN